MPSRWTRPVRYSDPHPITVPWSTCQRGLRDQDWFGLANPISRILGLPPSSVLRRCAQGHGKYLPTRPQGPRTVWARQPDFPNIGSSALIGLAALCPRAWQILRGSHRWSESGSPISLVKLVAITSIKSRHRHTHI